jgi:hypothetical protein
MIFVEAEIHVESVTMGESGDGTTDIRWLMVYVYREAPSSGRRGTELPRPGRRLHVIHLMSSIFSP